MKNKALDSNLDFDGMAGDGVNRAANKYAKNYHTGHSNDGRDVNVGRGPTKAGTTGDSVPNVTAKSGKINGGAHAKSPSNPDSINMGMKR
jgi:hypothetical protein